VSLRPSPTAGRSVFTYYAGQTRIPEGSAPDVKNKSFRIAADVEIPEGGADGVVITQGGRFCGWALCFLGGKPAFLYNTGDVFHYSVVAKDKLAPGRHALMVSFDYDGGGVGKGGKVTISVGDNPIAEGRIERTIPFRISIDETLDIGEDTGTPVSKDYQVPFRFTGKLNRVVVRLGDSKLTAEDEEQIRRAKAAIGLSQ
jgi:arylsulfatase